MAEIPGQVFDFAVNDSSLVGMLQKINTFTDVGHGGILGILLMIIVGGILFMMMRSFGNERAFPVSAIVTFILALFLKILGLLQDTPFWISVALLIISVLLLMREQSQFE